MVGEEDLKDTKLQESKEVKGGSGAWIIPLSKRPIPLQIIPMKDRIIRIDSIESNVCLQGFDFLIQ